MGKKINALAFAQDNLPTNIILQGTCKSRLTPVSGFLDAEVSFIREADDTFVVNVEYTGIGQSFNFEFEGERYYDNYYTMTNNSNVRGGIWAVEEGGSIEYTLFLDGGLTGAINWLQTSLSDV